MLRSAAAAAPHYGGLALSTCMELAQRILRIGVNAAFAMAMKVHDGTR
jgi:hypothetical protein